MDDSTGQFLSTLIQSSAAIVAIVGGLLAAQYVSLSSERAGLRRRVEDATRRLQDADQALATDVQALDHFTAFHAWKAIRNDVIESLGAADIHALIHESGWEPSPEVIETDIRPRVNFIRDFATACEATTDGGAALIEEAVSQGHDRKVARATARRVKDVREKRLAEEAAAQERERRLGPAGGVLGRAFNAAAFSSLIPPAQYIAPPSLITGVQVASRDAEQLSLEGDIREAERLVAAARAEHVLAAKAEQSLGPPRGSAAGLGIVIWMSCTGIVWPLILLGRNGGVSLATRSVLVALFATGLCAFAGHLWWQSLLPETKQRW